LNGYKGHTVKQKYNTTGKTHYWPQQLTIQIGGDYG